eukprot:SAG31_NODE_545_length_14238_cov_15.518849_3_plen_480_part_00
MQSVHSAALLLGLLSASARLPPTVQAMTHGWDCVACKTNSMLAANFGTWREDINLSDPWWINAIADSHHAIILNNFWKQGPGSYNGSGEDPKVTIARNLKRRNPELQVLFYQPADRLGDTQYVTDALVAHPEWWLRDDYGNMIPFGGHPSKCLPNQPKGVCPRAQIDPTVPAAQDFFANLSVSLFHDRAEAIELLDGVMVDGTSWTGPGRYGPNVSAARYEELFAGKMQMLVKMQAILSELNGHAEVWGNPLLEYGQIGGPGHAGDSVGARWNTTLAYYDGAFDEMFGSFGTMNSSTGQWDTVKMRWSFEAIINASAAGKTVVIHAFPGPAGKNDPLQGGMFPTRGDVATKNTFHVAAWAGPEPVPTDAAACRAVAADKLVQSLAPFLIVVTERVFFGYGWFYNLEDGYLPCPAEIECGMPHEWFPEYSKPLGPPKGPATPDAEKNVWTRSFAHADVSVDLRDRSLSKIVWHSEREQQW